MPSGNTSLCLKRHARGIASRHILKLFRSCYEINYTDCAGWFFEIKEENVAVPGRCSSSGRALSADRSEAETGEAF